MAAPKVTWQYLVDEIEQYPVAGILIDRSTRPINIQLLCEDRSCWLEDVSLPQVRKLSAEGKLPSHVLKYLTKTGLISL